MLIRMRTLAAIPANSDLAARAAQMERAGDFLAFTRALIANGGDVATAKGQFAASMPRRAELVQRAGIDFGRADGATWGHQLAEMRQASSAFAALARSRSVIGRMSGFRRVPFRVTVPRQTAGALVGWTQEGAPAPVGALGFDQLTFEQSKVSGIVVISRELAMSSDPDAQSLIDADLIAAAGGFLDAAFLDPSIAPAGEAPAAISYGATAVPASGTTAAALRKDLTDALEAMIAGGSDLTWPYIVMSRIQAARIGAMGESWTDGVGVNGGELLGVPVLTTTSAGLDDGGSPASQRIVLVDAAETLLAEGEIELSASQQGALDLSTTPDSPGTASTVLTPLWQRNLVAVRIVRAIRWERARAGAAAYISGASYRG